MAGPRAVLCNRQRGVRLAMPELREAAGRAVAACLPQRGLGEAILGALGEVEVTFISDAAIGKVHAEFMGEPAATDVITFAHGEILISAETAAREARAREEPLGRELVRYLVHGLLHLNGHEDDTPPAAAAMWAAQEAVVQELWPGADSEW